MVYSEYDFERRLVDNNTVFINAKLMGQETETIAEFPSNVEASQAFEGLKLILPEHIVFVSKTCTVAWRALDDNMKDGVMNILEDMVDGNTPFVVQ